jgi:hypothetical protein
MLGAVATIYKDGFQIGASMKAVSFNPGKDRILNNQFYQDYNSKLSHRAGRTPPLLSPVEG